MSEFRTPQKLTEHKKYTFYKKYDASLDCYIYKEKSLYLKRSKLVFCFIIFIFEFSCVQFKSPKNRPNSKLGSVQISA